MRRTAIAVGLLLLLADPAWPAGNIAPLLGAGGSATASSGGGSSYSGPLDVVASPKVWFGLRAASSADRGNVLVNACNSTAGVDVGCADLSSNATTGALVAGTVGGITCPGANCTVKTWYDRSGNGLDFTQATVAKRASLVANCVNTSLPCAVFSGGGYVGTLASTSLPLSHTLVFDRTGAQTQYLMNSGAQSIIGFSTADLERWQGGSNSIDATATDSTWHSVNFVYATTGSTSTVDVDGTQTTATNLGVADTMNTTGVGADTDGATAPYQGKLGEFGVWSGTGFTGTQITNMCHNMRLYWGTGGSC